MDLEEVRMWSNPLSIWELLEDRRAIYLRAVAAEKMIDAKDVTIARLELEKQMLRRQVDQARLLYADARLEVIEGRRLDRRSSHLTERKRR